MFAFIDQQNNVIGVVKDSISFSLNEPLVASNSAIYKCVEINDQQFLDSIIYMPLLDENLQPSGNTSITVPPGWRYVNETFIFDNKNNSFVEPMIDMSYPFTPPTTS